MASPVSTTQQRIADPLVPIPVPKQVPAKEGHAALAGVKLWYWDTGGSGQPVVFLHPNSGSSLSWLYQQPAFAQAGYRVIAYSRRGHYNSDPMRDGDTGIGSEDLHKLLDFLGVKKAHLVASAAGGSVAADYAVSHPERLFSLIISSNQAGQRKGYITDAAARIRPKEWEGLPMWFRELGPSYRGANPEGTKLWINIHEKSTGRHEARQGYANMITPETLEKFTLPTLLLCGDSDFSTPPSLLRMVARHIPSSEIVIVSEAGHSLYWERPDVFNAAVLDFIGRHHG